MPPPGRRAEYAEMTRRALVDAARALFAERGYASTSIDDVADAARVTKGAVYHHFKGKTDLFEAVCERVEVDIVAAIAQGPVGGTDPFEALVRGVDEYLDQCLRPEVQRILLLEAPTVLGWDRWRDLEARFGLGLTQAALGRDRGGDPSPPTGRGPGPHRVRSTGGRGALHRAGSRPRQGPYRDRPDRARPARGSEDSS